MSKRVFVTLAFLMTGALCGQAHAGLFDAFKSDARLRQEAMARGLNYHQASRAVSLIRYGETRMSGGLTSIQREAIKNGMEWHQAIRIH